MSRNVSLLSSDVDESRYQIERRLGQGAAGTVYLARDRETGEEVALKKLLRMDAKSVLRLKREFRALMDIAHPNIVKLYDMGRGSDAWFLTMEYLDGVDLTTYLTSEHSRTNAPPLPGNDNVGPTDQRRLSAFRQLAFGVSALHQSGMLHRDLKPSNVLVVEGRVVAKIKRGDTDLDRLSIDLLVAQIGAMLAPEAKQLLNVLGVAGRPMLAKLALAAAGVTRGGRALVHTLRSLNLVRTREFANERRLEIYHDRVRQSVYAALDADQRARVHQSLLSTLEFSQAAESDWLHTLALGAGALQSALQHGLVAAERADASLAFEQAAELYQRCLELTPAAEAPPLWNKLALAFVHCGRGAQAAEAYLEAAKHAEAGLALSLTQLAASHFLRSGRFERGEALMRQVLEEMNCPLPQSPGALMAAIAWESVRLKVRGLKYTLRAERDAPADLLTKQDIFAGLYGSIQSHDSLGGLLLQLRARRYALEAGEPRRLVRAFSSKALQIAYSGGSAQQAEALLQHAENLARQHCEREYANSAWCEPAWPLRRVA